MASDDTDAFICKQCGEVYVYSHDRCDACGGWDCIGEKDSVIFVCGNCDEVHDTWSDYCDVCGEWESILGRDTKESVDADEYDVGSSIANYSPPSGPQGMSSSDEIDELFNRAKSAYRQQQERERGRIRQDEKYAYDWVQNVIGFLTAIVNAFSAVWNSSCYITTAVIRHFGLQDDCYHLTVLRRFRDSYILYQGEEARLKDLDQYYQIAPEVISWIDAQSNAEEIWATLASTIVTAVEAIQAGQEAQAYEIYKTQILALSASLGGNRHEA